MLERTYFLIFYIYNPQANNVVGLATSNLSGFVINPDKFDKPITALRTAVDNDVTLGKESTSYNDIFDAFREFLAKEDSRL